MATKAFLEQAYLAYFGRPIDPNGVAAYVNSTPAQVEATFWASPESQALYGSVFGLQQINMVYQMLFGRDAEPAGLQYWANQLVIGAITPAGAAIAILNGARNDDITAVNNKLAASAAFTAGLDTTAEILGYAGDAAAAVARAFLGSITLTPATQAQVDAAIVASVAAGTGQANFGEVFTLTTGPDNIVGTAANDVVNGYVNKTILSTSSTLTGADVIDGRAGTDSLKLVVEGTGGVANVLGNATILNVEKFFVRDVSTGGSTYNFGTVTGETQAWADTATNNVTFSNLGTGATVGVRGNDVLTNLGQVNYGMANAADAVSIAIDGGVKNPVNVLNAAGGTAVEATISSTGKANAIGVVTLTGGGGATTVKALTVNAATNLTATLVGGDFAADAKLVVTGAGKVNLGAGFVGNTIDASANSGGLTISTTTGVTKSVIGSSGADNVTLVGTLAAAGAINLGAGDDHLLVGAGASIVGTNVIDGGEGKDSISASLINAANAAAIKNFELLDLSAATPTPLDVNLVTASTITGLTLAGGTGGATVTNVAAGVGLSVAGSNTGMTVIGVKGAAAGAADSFTTTFDGVAAPAATEAAPTVIAAGNVVTDGIEALNIVSGGTGFVTNTLAVSDNALQTLTITGNKGLGLTFVGANGTPVTGPTDTVNGVKLIDGSTATGALNVDTTGLNIANAGLTVKTGAGKDVITLAQKATVDAGAANDIITSAAGGGTFTGGAGNDTFNIGLAVATGTPAAVAIKSVITDLSAGDKLGFAAPASFVATKVALDASVTNLDQALALASNNAVAGQINWFQYGNTTYVVDNTNGVAGIQAGDVVVQLTGLVDLSASTLAGSVLTIG